MYVVLDFETTGLNYKKEQVIEVGAIKLNERFEEVGRLHFYVQTDVILSDFIQGYTKITPKMLFENGFMQWRASRMLREFCIGQIIVAQSASFDLSFLEKMNTDNYEFYCTRSMTMVAEPNERCSLGYTCERLGIKLENAHSAMEDVEATVELFRHRMLIDDLGKMKNVLVVQEDRPLNYIPPQTSEIKYSGISIFKRS